MNPRTPYSPLQRLIPAFFMSVGALLLVGVFLYMAHPRLAQAASGDLSSADTKYPQISGSRIDSCSLCHTSSIPGLNSYGAAYKNAGRNSAAFAAIESQDSDGDGFTNLQEINALTFPGNASDKPAAAATATSRPTNTPTRVPATNTPTSAPATNTPTRVPATSTAVPTQVNTPVPPTATSPAETSVPYPGPGDGTPTVIATSVPYPAPGNTPTVAATQAPTTAPTQAPTRKPSRTPAPTVQPTQGVVRLAPSADAYVSAQQASQNFGTDKTLKVSGNPQTRSYLSFNVPGLANGNRVRRAVLSVYVENPSGVSLTARRVSDGSWSEAQITFDNAPSTGSQVGSTNNRLSSGHWVSIDVTSLVKGSGSYSLALVARGSGSVTLASREDASHAPVLILLTSGSHHSDDHGGDD